MLLNFNATTVLHFLGHILATRVSVIEYLCSSYAFCLNIFLFQYSISTSLCVLCETSHFVSKLARPSDLKLYRLYTSERNISTKLKIISTICRSSVTSAYKQTDKRLTQRVRMYIETCSHTRAAYRVWEVVRIGDPYWQDGSSCQSACQPGRVSS